ncbi:cytochrome b/b6 domain-containing protein [Flammeovirga yaeyamensis]|uniref:Cytochrome b/b6 domain-containing protein n=1 Tax=Flammeovirga yaeyamensis TaxID=367791 RepID=A0AAX1N0P3_9BACT|nr:cytochrome b/b6 domain-containing protein [Flammeovirga yaeyamensis]MBB3698482.1 cytochrome b561 [Flammeovirga yaeyamensis]NMF34169.1 cytochrome b/b6 domain-containing protein [Flammeovirga yaeyamensis]QWG01154.1 cytochrome b/b6 domain-containing protein [Flammeovirga yaeyamensis]
MTNNNFSAPHRILHWLIAFTMLFITLTIFLRMNWMNKYLMSDIITEQLSNLDISITKKDSVKIAKVIRGQMWTWHIYAGYLMIGLLSLRVLLNIKERGIKLTTISSSEATGKEKFQWVLYALFYVLVAASLLTGMFIINDIGDHELMEDLHKLSLYYLVGFLVIHLVGVVAAELTDQKNIISEMISGKNK